MNERIRAVRKAVGLTLVEFSARIGIGNPALSLIENGKNNPSERTVRLICSEFNVNRRWLETGEGTMFIPEDEDFEIIDRFLDSTDIDSRIAAALFKGIVKTPGGWELLAKAVRAMNAELDKLDLDQ